MDLICLSNLLYFRQFKRKGNDEYLLPFPHEHIGLDTSKTLYLRRSEFDSLSYGSLAFKILIYFLKLMFGGTVGQVHF